MTSPIYRQADSRWGRLPYPRKPSTMASSACGCCSVVHCAMEQPKYATLTPKDARSFMAQYAVVGNGTKWVGMTKGLQHYGYTVKQPNIDKSMASAWTELNKGDRIGIILFRAGTKGGVRWTSGGHYVAFVGYKVKNGKHYFKTKDSGGRHHDGWYCYETQMKGLLRQIWIVKRKDPAIVNNKPYSKEFPEVTIKKGSTGEDVRRWQRFLNHVYGEVPKANPVAVDGKFGIKSDAWTGCFQVYCGITEDSIVGPNTRNHAKMFGV